LNETQIFVSTEVKISIVPRTIWA